ncbi:Alpha/Beta hydrolase protein [Umbelopsis sp. AD052]|nr:Alpha/Beta hydrolase protein [Umbelopsis sp. AD052]
MSVMNPDDPASFRHCEVNNLNGIRIHFVDENSSSGKVLLLLHGFPDLWFGWREQIPFLVSKGYRVIAPDLRGYGSTSSPEDHHVYGHKTVSDDLVALLDYLKIPKVTVLAHDWGGSVGWRFAQFYPKRTLAIAVFCTPYSPPNKEYIPLEDIVKRVPNFRYQLRLSSPDCDKELDADPEQFLMRMLRPCNDGVGPMYDADKDSIIQGRPKVARTKALSERQLKYYVDQYQKTGFHGPLNWYRTTKVRFEESKDLNPIINLPAMMVTASRDVALPPRMAVGMDKFIPKLEIHNIEDAGHWVLWEKPRECNQLLDRFLYQVYSTSKL